MRRVGGLNAGLALLLGCSVVTLACGGIAVVGTDGSGAGGWSASGLGLGGSIASSLGGAGPLLGGAGPVDPITPPGSVADGATAYAAQSCDSCHGVDAAGLYGPNITSSRPAGIGAWSYEQFHDALRFGKDRDGSPLCLLMTRYAVNELSERNVADLYAYLKSKPAVDRENSGTFCP